MLVRRGRLPGEAAFVAGKLACLADDARSDAIAGRPNGKRRANRLRNSFSRSHGGRGVLGPSSQPECLDRWSGSQVGCEGADGE
jgi:hypothetical protein